MKFVKIPTCKNILFGVLLFFVTFNVIVIFSHAYGDSIILSNSSEVQNLNKTTQSHPLSENIIDNKTINQTQEKNFHPVKQINDTDTVIEVFPISFEESLTKDDSDTSESNLLSLDQNNTMKVGNNTEFLHSPPPTISYIENEGVQVKPMTPVSKDGDRNTSDEEEDDESSRNTSDEEEDDESSRNTSDEEEDDESSRNTSDEEEDDESSRNTSDEEEDDESSRNTSDEEEDDESSRNTSDEEEDDESSRNTSDEEEDDESSRNTSDEEEDDESSRNTSDEEEDDESSRNTSDEEEDDESSRNTSDEEEDDESSRNTSDEEEDDESSRNTSDEEEDDESSRNTNEPIIRELYYKKSNLVSNNELIGNKTIGNSIDNENDKLISQVSELNSSVMPNLQMQADDPNSKSKDRKPIANAGLDQVITSDQNIVLDASASFDAEGKISSYLWKQTENSESKTNTSNSMIYSFPIPEDLEENSLEFKLIVMDEKGQIDTDTVNFLINDENDEENEN